LGLRVDIRVENPVGIRVTQSYEMSTQFELGLDTKVEDPGGVGLGITVCTKVGIGVEFPARLGLDKVVEYSVSVRVRVRVRV
jgi:hypothetical protein